MHVSSLFIYPVKSLRGCAVASAQVDALGFVGDRRFLIVDEEGRHLTQRTLPRMAQISAELSDGKLVLRAEGAGSISVPLSATGATQYRTVSIWRSHGLLADDCGPQVSAWLSDFMNVRCDLVRAGDRFRRPVLQKPDRGLAGPVDPGAEPVEGRIVTTDLLNFADGYPLLVTSEASLAALNDRILETGEEPVPMNRFRPNIVISGCRPFEEDTWPRIKIGDVVLRAGGQSARCVMTTTDQVSGERPSKEPLRTLATFRRDAINPSDVNFGQNFANETKKGEVHVRAEVTILPA